MLSGGDMVGAARVFGLMAGAWASMNFIASPILGALSDRYGRRRVILISAFGFSLDLLIMALAPTITWLFIGRAVSGLFFADSGSVAEIQPHAAETDGRDFEALAQFARLHLLLLVHLSSGPLLMDAYVSIHGIAPLDDPTHTLRHCLS